MPTYEYRCTNGHGFEDFVLKMSDAKTQLPCPTCGERGERHLSAGGGLVFKGSGFYITDYGKDGKKSPAPAPTDRTTTDGAKSDGAKSDGEKSDGAKSDGQKSDGAKQESARAESAKSEGSRSEGPKSDAAKPESAKSDGAKSVGAKSDTAKSDSAKSRRGPGAPVAPKSGSE